MRFGCSVISDEELSKIQIEGSAGTPIYMAPEIFSNNPYSYKVDVYSFSLVIYELLTGIRPFSEYKSKLKLIKDKKQGKEPDLSHIKDEKIKIFLKSCWSIDPSKRPSFKMIVDFILLPEFRSAFHINDELLFIYYNIFDEDLRDKNKKDEFDFDQEINYGNIDAIRKMAYKYFYGIGVEKNIEKAAHYHHIASQRGDTVSMFNYARMLQKGRGVKMNKDIARYIYKKAAISGETLGLYNYAHMYLQGEGVEKDVKKASRLFEMGSFLNNVKCLNIYGSLLLNNLSLYDPEKAGECFKKGADINFNDISMLEYAVFLLKQDKDKNLMEAVSYIKKSADLKNIDSLIRYSFFLWNGIGVKQNQTKAKHYIKKAINMSNTFMIINFALVKSKNNIIIFHKESIIDHFLIAFERLKNDFNFN